MTSRDSDEPIEAAPDGPAHPCPCGALVDPDVVDCPACGRAPWRRGRVAWAVRRRGTWLIAAALAVGVAGTIAVAIGPDEATQARRMRDAAAKALAEGDLGAAASMLEACVRKAPDDANAWLLLAYARYRRGERSAAADAAERAWRINRTMSGAANLLARCRLDGGDPRGALAAAADAPESDARIVEALAACALGRPAVAAAALDRIDDSALVDLPVLTFATRLSAELGGRSFPGSTKRRERAVKLGRRLAERAEDVARERPDDPVAALAIAVAAGVDPGADVADVDRMFERAASLSAGGVDARVARVEFLTRTGRVDDARKLVASLEASADAAAAPCKAALVRLGGAPAADDSSAAPSRDDAAVARRPDDPSLLLRPHASALQSLIRARAAGRAPTTEETAALAVLEQARAADPDDATALAWAARLAAAEGDSKRAAALARRRAEISPEDPAARADAYELTSAGADDAELDALSTSLVTQDGAPADDFRIFAAAALRHGRVAVAARVAAGGVAKWPKDEGLRVVFAHALLVAGDPRGAESQIVETFGASPKTRDAREVLAWARGLAGDADAAVAAMPSSDAPADVAARARLRAGLGRLEEAQTELRKSLAAHPAEPILVRALAEILLAVGKADEAVELLEASARRDDADLATLVLLGEALATALPDAGASSGRLAELRGRMTALPEGAVDALRLDARIAAAAGDLKSARSLLDRHLALRPADARAWFEAARVRAKAGDDAAAVAALRRAVEIAPGFVEARTALAQALYADAARRFGAGDDARVALGEIVSLAPDWTEPRMRLAVSLFDDGLPDLSEAQCRAILVREPANVVARIVLATIKGLRGDAAGAAADMDALVAAHPDRPALRLRRGLARLQASRAAEAQADFKDAAAAGVSGPELEYGLAGCAVADGRAAEALAHARRAVELAPTAAYAHRALGEATALAGDEDAAVAAWNTAYRLDPRDPSPVVAAATLLARAGRWQEAFVETGRIAQPAGAALALRAEAAFHLGMVEDARRWFERAAFEYPAAWVRVGELAQDRGDREAAARAYGRAVDAGAADRRTLFRYGASSLALGRADVAAAVFEKLLVETPDDVGALNNLALALASAWTDPPSDLGEASVAARRKLLERALAAAARARELAPRNPDVADTFGWVRYVAGDVVGAREMFDEALRVSDGKCAEARFHAALDDLRLGRTDAARAGLRRALEHAPRDAAWTARARALLDSTK